jgi:hypothetical protein
VGAAGGALGLAFGFLRLDAVSASRLPWGSTVLAGSRWGCSSACPTPSSRSSPPGVAPAPDCLDRCRCAAVSKVPSVLSDRPVVGQYVPRRRSSLLRTSADEASQRSWGETGPFGPAPREPLGLSSGHRGSFRGGFQWERAAGNQARSDDEEVS